MSEAAALESTPEAQPVGTFGISLALSGAISAGAYTAGVLDFLIQALDEWERCLGDSGTPQHDACITVIAGASAGAIVGALGLVDLSRGLRRVTVPDAPGYQTVKCVLPALYEAWVTDSRMTTAPGMDGFLGLGDVDPRKAPVLVQSVLNADLLDTIKQKALSAPTGPPGQPHPPPRYVSDAVHVYLTISNLRGIPYDIRFGLSSYEMCSHGDRVHYTVANLGGSRYQASAWAHRDRVIAALDANGLPRNPGAAVPPDWDGFGTAALASSAFPIGLAPRKMEVPFENYVSRQYPMDVPLDCGINPKFPPAATASPYFRFLNVDGGLINNNPFDYALYGLMGRPAVPAVAGSPVAARIAVPVKPAAHTEGTLADRAVIMVSPFPEPPAFPAEGQPAAELVGVLRALFPALISQSRFRASELAPAINQQDYSRFLIAPRRKLDGAEKEEQYAIACGLLGGFGGFLHEPFRAHDYQLGRRNCQRFLQTIFGLPADNPIVATTPAVFEIKADALHGRPAATYPIIPLLGDATAEVRLPDWPRMKQADVDELMKQVRARLRAIGPAIVNAQTDRWALRTIAKTGLWFCRDDILKSARGAILADLVRRDQIVGWTPDPGLVAWAATQHAEPGAAGITFGATALSAIFAAFAGTAFDQRTAAGVAKAAHLPIFFVEAALDQLTRYPSKPYGIRQIGNTSGEPLYCLNSRAPLAIREWPIIRQACNLWSRPKTDAA